MERVLVPSPAGKDFGSCHPCPHKKKKKKKTEKTQNQQLFLDPSENWGHRAYLLQLWKLERQVNTRHDNLPGLETTAAATPGRSTCRVIDRLLEMEQRLAWTNLLRKDPSFSWVLLPGTPPGSQGEDWRKIRLCSKGRGWKLSRKVTVLKYAQSFLLSLTKICPQGNLFYQYLTSMCFTRA